MLAPVPRHCTESGSRLMLATAAIYSLTSVISKAALLQVTPAFFGPFYFVTLGFCTTLVFASRNPHTCVPWAGTRGYTSPLAPAWR
jgi:hypothetical protein